MDGDEKSPARRHREIARSRFRRDIGKPVFTKEGSLDGNNIKLNNELKIRSNKIYSHKLNAFHKTMEIYLRWNMILYILMLS